MKVMVLTTRNLKGHMVSPGRHGHLLVQRAHLLRKQVYSAMHFTDLAP